MQLVSRIRSKSSSPSSTPKPSPKKSPSTPGFSTATNVFLGLRRLQRQARIHPEPLIQASSGELDTLSTIPDTKSPQIRVIDMYICIGGVSMYALLCSTREQAMLAAEMLDGHRGNKIRLVEERWQYTISQKRADNSYRVDIEYTCCGVHTNGTPDGGRPVATDKIKSVIGLMSIVDNCITFPGLMK